MSYMNDSITIRFPQELSRELKRICKLENIPLSDIVRESVRKYLLSRRFHKLRDKVLPFAEAAGLLTDEDVFKALS